MAMNVTFKKGSEKKFTDLNQKDNNTFYYLDSNTLYLGDQLIGGKKALDRIDSLEGAISGLSGAMHFRGSLNDLPEDNSGYHQGDVILVQQKEYVLVEESGQKKWEELGDESSFALKSIQITADNGLAGGGDLQKNITISLSQDTKANIEKGVTANGWGNHAEAGYLTKTDAAGTYEAKGAVTKVQGETTNTVRDCVDAINKLNNTYSTEKKELSKDIENVVAQLTWGSF